MNICYVAGRERDYPRNRIIIRGLKENDVDIIECIPDMRSRWNCFRALKKFYSHRQEDYDCVVVGFLGQPLIPFVKALTQKKIIFDAFLSVYDTMVFDRRKFGPKSIGGKFCYYLDKKSCELADRVILDTNQHIKYFKEKFGLDEVIFKRILVGTDDSVFYPRTNSGKNWSFLVHFHGEFQNLHGIKYIIESAKILEHEGIEFQIVGKGQTYKSISALAKNVTNITFIDSVPYAKLADFMAYSDICLGIFGETPKVQRVIPNKVYEALAMGKPLITADTPAIHELLEDRKDALLCRAADPESLAEAILELKNDERLRKRISERGYNTFKERCTPKVIGKEIREIIQNLLDGGR